MWTVRSFRLAELKSGRIDEYCDTEVFRAECSEGEVLILEKARYGRMRIGRCVEFDMGHIGCSTDVLRLADRRCSGRRVCELRVPDAEFESTHPCLKELKTYLEASYTCIKGKLLRLIGSFFSMQSIYYLQGQRLSSCAQSNCEDGWLSACVAIRKAISTDPYYSH